MIVSFGRNRCRDGGTTGQETAAPERSVWYTTYLTDRLGSVYHRLSPRISRRKPVAQHDRSINRHASHRENIGEDFAMQNCLRLRLHDERKRRKRQKMELSLVGGTMRTSLGACSAFNPWAPSPGIGHEASQLLSQPPSASIRHRHGRDTSVILQNQEGHQGPTDGEQTQSGQHRG